MHIHTHTHTHTHIHTYTHTHIHTYTHTHIHTYTHTHIHTYTHTHTHIHIHTMYVCMYVLEELSIVRVQQDYLLELLRLLSLCAPCKYVFVNGRAKRESEESALLIHAAIPVAHVVDLLFNLSLRQSHIKAAILSFLAQ